MAPEIAIHKNCNGYLSISDVLRPIGSMQLTIENLPEIVGEQEVFTVTSDKFSFQFVIGPQQIKIQRNGYIAAVEVRPGPIRHSVVACSWSPTYLAAGNLFPGFPCSLQFAEVTTPVTIASRALLRHARSIRLSYSEGFASYDAFRESVHHALDLNPAWHHRLGVEKTRNPRRFMRLLEV